MRTLYMRIIVMTMLIMISSGVIAFIATNVYYHHYLKPTNDQRITHIAQKTVSMFEKSDDQEVDVYLTALTDLGYQFYLIDQDFNEQMFGHAFRDNEIGQTDIQNVLNGETYHGIANYPWKLFVTGFFDNELKNTIGVPLEIAGENKALFVRPNTIHLFGEMRYFLAVLLVLVLLFSFLLVLISTTFIVRPIKKLTEATKTIAAGNYHLKLKVNRKDEIGRLANDFTKMSDSLKRTDKQRQEFVSNVSHEIQSPLTSIQGFSQALREEDIPLETREKYLSIIEQESRRLSGLSKQLLMLSFLDSEINSDELITINLADQLREVVNTTEWQWREKNLTIELDIYTYRILCDPRLLQQVWMNLLINAIHFSHEGGTIWVSMKKNKDGMVVSIKDNGIGINKSDMPLLFDRFYKADKARTRKDSGTGIGLSIVKKVIELHQGTITVESEYEKGSEFLIFLPTSTV